MISGSYRILDHFSDKSTHGILIINETSLFTPAALTVTEFGPLEVCLRQRAEFPFGLIFAFLRNLQ